MENSKIEWTDHTFNPWIGCQKVSAGCANCYAESFANRFGLAEWGAAGTRVRTSAVNWRQPLSWNRKAQAKGVRAKVFCASLADVFEDREEVAPWRADLFDLIAQTKSLDWLLLTKRPENVNCMVPARWLAPGLWPVNVWIGTSVENQAAADERIPHLLEVPAQVRFLSMEPLLGYVDLSGRTVDDVWIDQDYADSDPELGRVVAREGWPIHWVIVGGESGEHARPMLEPWARYALYQCGAAGVPFFFKQWGEYSPDSALRVGKARAGRVLCGREWNQFPQEVA